MNTYETKGKQQESAYEAAIKSGNDDTPIVGTEAELSGHEPNKAFLDITKNDQYKVSDEIVTLSDIGLKELKNFRAGELGFDIQSSKRLQQTVVKNVPGDPAANPASGDTINRGTYDTSGNFIVYQDAFKEANTVTGAKKTPLNEMGAQNFIRAAGDNAKNLKAAFLTDVQNKEFWGITRQNYNDMKQPFSQVLTFKSGTPQFDRYMGSPNFGSKWLSFINHHNAIGNAVPDKIVVIPKDYELPGSKPPVTVGTLTAAVVFKDADAT